MEKAERIVPTPALRMRGGSHEGQVIRIEDTGTLGRREDNRYVLDDPAVSRVHAEVRRESGAVIITDLGSSAGTTVNGERLTGPRAIRHGDLVGFGPVECRFEDPTQAARPDEPTVVFEVPDVRTGPRLAPRQQEVLERMAEGLTNGEIAERLGVTERTVKAYAQEIYVKLDVRNRASAVAEAARWGMLPDITGRGR